MSRIAVASPLTQLSNFQLPLQIVGRRRVLHPLVQAPPLAARGMGYGPSSYVELRATRASEELSTTNGSWPVDLVLGRARCTRRRELGSTAAT